MLALNPHNDHDKAPLLGLDKMIGAESMYDGFKKLVVSVTVRKILLAVLSVVASPWIFYSGFILRRKRRQLAKLCKDLKKDSVLTSDQYVSLKEITTHIKEMAPQLEKISEYSIKETPVFLKFTVLQMVKLSKTVLLLSPAVNQKLAKYNTPKQVTDSKTFMFKKEEEIWKNRCTAYKYLA